MNVDQPHISKKINTIEYINSYLNELNKIIDKLVYGRDIIKNHISKNDISDDAILNERLQKLNNKIDFLKENISILTLALDKAKNESDYSNLYTFFNEHINGILEDDIHQFL